jgi:hypothetical protein
LNCSGNVAIANAAMIAAIAIQSDLFTADSSCSDRGGAVWSLDHLTAALLAVVGGKEMEDQER